MGHGICILSCGLSFIALSIVIAMLGSSFWIYLLFAAVTVVGLFAIEWRNLAKTYRRVEDEAYLEQGVRRR